MAFMGLIWSFDALGPTVLVGSNFELRKDLKSPFFQQLYWQMVEILFSFFQWTWNQKDFDLIQILRTETIVRPVSYRVTGSNTTEKLQQNILMLQNLKFKTGCWKWAMRSAINAAHSIVCGPTLSIRIARSVYRSPVSNWRFVTGVVMCHRYINFIL